MLNWWVEIDFLDNLEQIGVGCISFLPLQQGLLTEIYLQGVPVGSKAAKPQCFLELEHITKKLNIIT